MQNITVHGNCSLVYTDPSQWFLQVNNQAELFLSMRIKWSDMVCIYTSMCLDIFLTNNQIKYILSYKDKPKHLHFTVFHTDKAPPQNVFLSLLLLCSYSEPFSIKAFSKLTGKLYRTSSVLKLPCFVFFLWNSLKALSVSGSSHTERILKLQNGYNSQSECLHDDWLQLFWCSTNAFIWQTFFHHYIIITACVSTLYDVFSAVPLCVLQVYR